MDRNLTHYYAGFQRGTQFGLHFNLRVQIIVAATWNGCEQGLFQAQRDFFCQTFPHVGPRQFLPRLVQLYCFKKTEAVIQQSLAFAGAGGFRRRPHNRADQPHAITLGRGGQAVAGCLGMAGFEPVNRRITP